MYDLHNFCNIISQLRRKKGWTQTDFAGRLGISPQSVSKWECGVGFPDVTLFPAIAETLSVPIGMLFGEKNETEEKMEKRQNQYNTELIEEFEKCNTISVYCGNICRIEVINEVSEKGHVHVVGDPVFLRYFALEYVPGQGDADRIMINIKNPSGSDVYWKSYDRQDYEGENFVRIFTGCLNADVNVNNYLDLNAVSSINPQGNLEVICHKAGEKLF